MFVHLPLAGIFQVLFSFILKYFEIASVLYASQKIFFFDTCSATIIWSFMAIIFKAAKLTTCHIRKYYYCFIQKENQDREEAKLATSNKPYGRKKNVHPSLPSASLSPQLSCTKSSAVTKTQETGGLK